MILPTTMKTSRLILLPLLLIGCSGPAPGPPPPDAVQSGVAPHYEKAYAALRVHPAVQAFAAEHLDPSQTLGISVSRELVPLDYGLVADGFTSASASGSAAVRDSLAALAASDHFAPTMDDALPLLSMEQQHPLVVFFGEMRDGRLPAQLYPNPYRREGFEAITADVAGLALLIVFDGASVDEVYTGPILPE